MFQINSLHNLNQADFFAKVSEIMLKVMLPAYVTRVPDPTDPAYPVRAALTAAWALYEPAYAASVNGGQVERDARDQTRAALAELLEKFGSYVATVAANAEDLTILDDSGFDRRKEPVQLPDGFVLPAPAITLGHDTLSGVVVLRSSRLDGAGSYLVHLCTGDPSVEANWHQALISKVCRRIVLTGLTPGQLYYVRVCGIGRNGPGAWSDVAGLMAT